MGFRPLESAPAEERPRGFRPLNAQPAASSAPEPASAPITQPEGPTIGGFIRSLLPSAGEALESAGRAAPFLAPLGIAGRILSTLDAARTRRGVMDGYVAPEPEIRAPEGYTGLDLSGNMTRPLKPVTAAPPVAREATSFVPLGSGEIVPEIGNRVRQMISQRVAGTELGVRDALAPLGVLQDPGARADLLRRAREADAELSRSSMRLESPVGDASVGRGATGRIGELVRALTPDRDAVAAGAAGFATQFPGLAMSLAARSALPMVSEMSQQVFGQDYAAGLQEGLPPELAAKRAVEKSVVNVVTELPVLAALREVPIGQIFSPGADAAQKLAAGRYLAAVSGTEMGSELVASIGEWAADVATASPDATLEQLASNLRDTFQQMLIQGPLTAGAGRGMRAAPGVVRDLEERINPQGAIAREVARMVEEGPVVDATILSERRVMRGDVRPAPEPPAPAGAPPFDAEALLDPEARAEFTLREIVRRELEGNQGAAPLPDILPEFGGRARDQRPSGLPDIVLPEDRADPPPPGGAGGDPLAAAIRAELQRRTRAEASPVGMENIYDSAGGDRPPPAAEPPVAPDRDGTALGMGGQNVVQASQQAGADWRQATERIARAGREGGGTGVAAAQAAAAAEALAAAGQAQPLRGLPSDPLPMSDGWYVPGPYEPAHRVAEEYAREAGIDYKPARDYAQVDQERAKRIATEFDKMRHDPGNPEVQRAYRAMVDETLAQWRAIKRSGLKVEFIRPDMADPYAKSPRQAIQDVIKNNHLWVFPTDSGFGSSDADISGNPLLELTDEVIDGYRLRANDVFRIVHDYFGHIKDGNGFRAGGEENAWRSHAAMYSPLARRAMTTETRGQNSWVNFGPHGDKNRSASGADTVYADQKVGLLPEWVSEEGRGDGDAQTRDNRAQSEWLNKRAKSAGFRDLDEMAAKNPAMFGELAGQWRDQREGALGANGGGSNLTQRELDAFAERLKKEIGINELDLRLLPSGDVRIDVIAAKQTGTGAGTRAMREIVDFADERGIRLVLSLADKGYQPIESGPKTTSRERLRKFYERFGFVMNAGRNKDYRLSMYDSMYREPKARALAMGADGGQPGALLAPNGKPSNLPPELYHVVRTEKFKRWFGDWEKFAKMRGGVWNDSKGEVSKIVDENGEPLVVYHGSRRGGFRVFDMNPENRRRRGPSVFFTTNRAIAETYSGRMRDVEINQAEDLDGFDPNPGIYPVFLNIRNPLEEDFRGANWDGTWLDQKYQVISREESGMLLTDRRGNDLFDSREEAEQAADEMSDESAMVVEADDLPHSTDDIVRESARYGHDGAIIRNVVDNGPSGNAWEPSDVFIITQGSRQAKSVWNVGEFGADADDILAAAQPRLLVKPPEMELSGREVGVERRARNRVESDIDNMVREYRRRFGSVIDTDSARELFYEYRRSPAARREFAAAVHEPASAIANETYRRMLAEPVPSGAAPTVLFTSGGAGAGKTRGLRAIPALKQISRLSNITYDSNLASFHSAQRKIEAALEAGRNVAIVFVMRDPVTAYIKGVIPRAMDPAYGRTVRSDVFVKNTIGSLETFKRLVGHYGNDERVRLHAIDNTGARPVEMPLDTLAQHEFSVTEQEIENAIEAEFRAGRISREVYEAVSANQRRQAVRPEPANKQGGAALPEKGRAPKVKTGSAQELGFILREDINGIEKMNDEQVAAVQASIERLMSAGRLPAFLLDGINGFAVYGASYSSNQAQFWASTRVIAFDKAWLNAWTNLGLQARLDEVIAHELQHHIDIPTRAAESIVAGTSRLDVKTFADGSVEMFGDLGEEIASAMSANTKVKLHFSYPLGPLQEGRMSPRDGKLELLAQVGSLYFTDPALVRRTMPQWYAVMETTYGTQGQDGEAGSLDEARQRLRKALQNQGAKPGVSGAVAGREQPLGVAGPNQPGAPRGPPGPGVGGRTAAGTGNPGGGAVPPAGNRGQGAGTGGAGGRINWNSSLVKGPRDDLIREFQDKAIDLKRVQQAIERAGGTIREPGNAYLADELYLSRVTARTRRFTEGMVKPLLRDIKKSDLTIEQVGDYLWARHAPERNKQMAKINPGGPANLSGLFDNARQAAIAGQPGARNAADIIAGFTAKQRADLDRIAKQIDAITKSTRDILVNSNLEDAKTIKAWEGAYKHYVPLFRDVDEVGTGQGFQVSGPESKRAMGSTQEAIGIVAAIIAQHERAITRSEKAEVARSLLRLAEDFPNPAFWRVDQPPVKRTINKTTGLVQIGTDPMFRQRDDVLVVKDKDRNTGEIVERVIAFNPDNDTAMKLAAAMRNLDVVQLAGMTKAVGKVTRIMASLVTSWNPLFWTTNFARDVQTAAVNLQNTPLAGQAPKVMANIMPAMAGIASAEFRDGQSKWARLYREFEDEGGKTGWMRLFDDLIDRQKQMEREIAASQRGNIDPRKWATLTIDTIEAANTAVENATRLAAYAAAKDRGLSNKQAASLAKNLTVNFNRKGNRSTAINSWFMFFNASVQGSARLIKAVVQSRRAQAMVGTMVAFGAALELVNRLIGDDDRDEDGNNPYEMLPEFIKQKNMVFMLPGGKRVTIPLPYGYNVFHNAGRLMMEAVLSASGSDLVDTKKKPMEMAWHFAEVVIDSFLPFGGTTTPAQLVSPTVLDPVVQWAENKTWFGSPMRPEPLPFGPAKPNHQLYFRSTSDTAKDLSKWLSDMTGGDEIRGGAIDISPTTLVHIFKTVTGGSGAFGLGMFDFSNHVVGRIVGEREADDMPWKSVPFVGKFYGEVDDRDVAARYYQLRERAVKALGQYQSYRKLGDAEGMERVEVEQPEYLAMGRVLNQSRFKREMTGIRKDFDATRELSGVERERARRDLRAEERAIMAEALRAYNDAVRENRQ